MNAESGSRLVAMGMSTPPISQQSTGIAGLDSLLRGGLVEGGVYLVLGRPGTGKTTLGNHLAFNVVSEGHNALYVTVMAESHDRMLKHLSGFSFLDPEQVGERIHYLSVYDELIEHGLDGVQATLRRAIRDDGYRLVVIDGAGVLEMAAESHLEYSRFVADLGVQMSALGCTIVLLALHPVHPEDQSIAPYVDGIFALEDHSVGLQDIRYIHMVKVRGVEHIRGRHRFTITTRGIEVYPRLESVVETPGTGLTANLARVSTGVPALDTILSGGYLEGTSTLVWGPPGIGKTMLGLHFIEQGARHGERCLVATFYETAETLEFLARGVNLQFASLMERDLIHLYATNNPELPADDWAWKLLETVDEYQPARVLIDGISEVSRLGLEAHRLTAFYRALSSQLSSRGVSAMYTARSIEMFGPGLGMPESEIVALSDNVLLMHYVQAISRMHRFLSVFKVRGTAHDQVSHEFRITDHGIALNENADDSARILSAAATAHDDMQRHSSHGATPETTR